MIHIIRHKDYDFPIPSGYVTCEVGPLFKGDRPNINELNPIINELTGIYDVWKNFDDENTNEAFRDASINAGLDGITAQMGNNAINSMQNVFGLQTAINTGFNGLQAQLAQCCCEVQSLYDRGRPNYIR